MNHLYRSVVRSSGKTAIKWQTTILKGNNIFPRFMTSAQTEACRTTLDQNFINEFQQNGVVCIRGAFDSSWRDLVQKGIEKNLEKPSKYCDMLKGEDGDGIYFNDYYNWDKIEEFESFVRKSPAAKLAGLLMQSSVSQGLKLFIIVLTLYEEGQPKQRLMGAILEYHTPPLILKF